jgi:hypothetical protein
VTDQALKDLDVLINLVNLIEHRTKGVPLIRFHNHAAFLAYTLNGHVFPRSAAKKDVFIRALLRVL